MPATPVSFTDVTSEGLESSPVESALAGLRANALAGEIRGSFFVIKGEHPLPEGL
ncbi:hypothetical protein [Brachybacterium sp. HMSC06H03]|uniref:hypothetical protein n=1 Tax=Brachybacterium sp. HMSC06H03 TaxID=1581127 RepID=UPI001AEF8F58|nr:hypothetical protein [Brachybacterium sp. HMSC06H03]